MASLPQDQARIVIALLWKVVEWLGAGIVALFGAVYGLVRRDLRRVDRRASKLTNSMDGFATKQALDNLEEAMRRDLDSIQEEQDRRVSEADRKIEQLTNALEERFDKRFDRLEESTNRVHQRIDDLINQRRVDIR